MEIVSSVLEFGQHLVNGIWENPALSAVIERQPDGNLGLLIPDNFINEGRQILLSSFKTHGIYIKEIRPLSALPFVQLAGHLG